MFKRPPGRVPGALIDQCGLRGLTVGGAQVSEKHAGFVVNRGGATCADVLQLVDQVRARVLAQTGVELEMEVRVVRAAHLKKKIPQGGENWNLSSYLAFPGRERARQASIMEDLDFFCVDNLPAPLIPKFAELAWRKRGGAGHRRAGGHQLRQPVSGAGQPEGDAVLLPHPVYGRLGCIERYKESRRSHPLSEACLEEAMSGAEDAPPLCAIGQSTSLTPQTSPPPCAASLPGASAEGRMEVRVSSFGFKFGLPMEADLGFDVRFLPNPYYVANCPVLDGAVPGIPSGRHGREFLGRLRELVLWLLPRYEEEGKTALVIAVGCTGGHHRSVAIAHALAEGLRTQGWLGEPPGPGSELRGEETAMKNLMPDLQQWERGPKIVPPSAGPGCPHAAGPEEIHQEPDCHRHGG